MTATPMATRRTQTERRQASRARLLEAAVECLAERGYAGTTFAEVLRRAGMSNGAMWRHFRSKADLLVAATLHSMSLLNELRPDPSLDALSPACRLDATVDRLWALVREPAFLALIELLPAGRIDAELQSVLEASDNDAGEIFFVSTRHLLGPELSAHPAFRRNVRLLGMSLYGVALTAGLRPPASERELRRDVKRLGRRLFDLPAMSDEAR